MLAVGLEGKGQLSLELVRKLRNTQERLQRDRLLNMSGTPAMHNAYEIRVGLRRV